jgi:hypothetical protein
VLVSELLDQVRLLAAHGLLLPLLRRDDVAGSSGKRPLHPHSDNIVCRAPHVHGLS